MMTNREPPEPVQIGLGEKRFVPTPPAPSEPPASPKSIPWKKIGEGLAAVPKSIPWMKIGRGLAAALSAFPKMLLLLSFVALVGFTIAELRRDVVVIEPIRLPEALRQRGYSGDVAADRLWDEMARINKSIRTAKVPVALQPASQKMDFEPPGSGIALQEVVQMLRRLFRRNETRIVGEITCARTACEPEGLALRLRVFHGDGMKSDPIIIPPVSPTGGRTNEAETDRCDRIKSEPINNIPVSRTGGQTNEAEIDRHFRAAALELLRELDPYVVALYLYQDNKDAAECEALKLIVRTGPERKWALNLLGIIAADRGKYDAAIGWYDKAIRANKKDKFAAMATTNWGNALVDKRDLAKAIEKFELAAKLDWKNAVAHNSWGIALGKMGEPAKAIKHFTHATMLDEKYAGAYTNWGSALGKSDKLTEAVKKFTLATDADPTYAAAFFGKAFALKKLSEGDDPAGRLQRYARDAADAFERYRGLVEPDTVKANWALAQIKKLRAGPPDR